MVRLGQIRQPRRPKVHVAARAQSGDSKFSDKQRVCSKRRNVSGARCGTPRSDVQAKAPLVAETGHRLWADRYDRDPSDVFAAQDEIANCAVYPARAIFVVIRLLRPLKFVDPARNAVDPQSNEFAS